MPRGGARPGAGRPRKPVPKAVQEVQRFDLVKRLAKFPAGPIGRQRRAVLTMACYDAPLDVIAASLAISEPELREFYADELATGTALKLCNLTSALWDLARAGNPRAVIELGRMMARAEQEQSR